MESGMWNIRRHNQSQGWAVNLWESYQSQDYCIKYFQVKISWLRGWTETFRDDRYIHGIDRGDSFKEVYLVSNSSHCKH